MNISNIPYIKYVRVIEENRDVMRYCRKDIHECDVFPVGCIFKAFLAILVGNAILEGKINSINDCIIDYVQHEDDFDANWYSVKLKHALSKTTGLRWPGPNVALPANMSEVMKLSFDSKPGESFQYKPDPQIIVYLLEEIYRTEITELFRKKVVAAFRHQDYEWDSCDIEGMRVSPDMLCELGGLLLNKGSINGKRLFSEEYYKEMVTPYSDGGFPECCRYGLGVWIDKDDDRDIVKATGFGGQILSVDPRSKQVVCILSDMDRPHPENRNVMFELLSSSEQGGDGHR